MAGGFVSNRGMQDWQHLAPLAQAVSEGRIKGFFSQKAVAMNLPDRFANGDPVSIMQAPGGLIIGGPRLCEVFGAATLTEAHTRLIESRQLPSALQRRRNAKAARKGYPPEYTSSTLAPKSLEDALALGPISGDGRTDRQLLVAAFAADHICVDLTNTPSQEQSPTDFLFSFWPNARIFTANQMPTPGQALLLTGAVQGFRRASSEQKIHILLFVALLLCAANAIVFAFWLNWHLPWVVAGALTLVLLLGEWTRRRFPSSP